MQTLLTVVAVASFIQGLAHFGACDASSDVASVESKLNSSAHHRRRRYVVFPEGSTLSAAACISPAAITDSGGIFTSGVAWAISYDLPNETIHRKTAGPDFPMPIRRHKRDLYARMEKLIDWSGFDGRACLLKAICESTQHLTPRSGVLQEILRLIFSYPPEEDSQVEANVFGEFPYAKAHMNGNSNANCNALYACPVSLLQMGLNLGKY